MREANFTVALMHGEMTQKERETVITDFRSGSRCVESVPVVTKQPTSNQFNFRWISVAEC